MAIYGFDIWDAIDGRVPLRRALALLDRLSDEPKSIWRAKQLGGPELKDYTKWIGWDANTYLLADLYDAIQQNSALLIAVNSDKHEVPEIPPYPRPSDKPVEKPTQSLDDFASKLVSLFGPGIAS